MYMANEITPGQKMFDRNHASKIFVDNNYGLSPKYGWLFHVAFDVNPEVARISNDDLLRMGFVVKTASLPKFQADVKTMNAYNRVDLVQTKVKYDPLSIKFHDDNLDVVRNFWYDYYSYYYRDSDWNLSIYSSPTKYSERQQQGWGYSPRQYPASSPGTQQYLSAIRIYSLHNKRFAEYTLINPMITSFKHGEHAQGNEGGTLENEMSISYQAVKYQYGTVSEETVSGFAMLQYDARPSPLGTTPTSDNEIHDLSEGMTGLPGILNNLKNINGSAILGGALSTLGSGLISGATSFGVGALKDSAAGKAVAGGLASAGAFLKGKVFSNGEGINSGSSTNLFAGLTGDNAGPSTDVQGKIDQVTAQLASDETALEQAATDLADAQLRAEQLTSQIDNDVYSLENDELTDEDRQALQALIDENQAQLDQVTSEIPDLEDSVNGLTDAVFAGQNQLSELQEAQNPSGNSPEEGGAGSEDSKTVYESETGSTTTTNPDGSRTVVESDGSIYTVPQQNAVPNPAASSNQKIPVFKLSETSNPSNFRN